jgi:hypothetical protein
MLSMISGMRMMMAIETKACVKKVPTITFFMRLALAIEIFSEAATS